MLWLAFPPVDWGVLAWAALIPWLVMIARASPRHAVLWSAIASAGLFVGLLHWLRFVTVAGWLLLALYCAVYWPASALLIGWLKRRRVPLLLSAPLVLTVAEFARANLLTGFPFYLLGHSQYARPVLIQIADITGVYGITFLILLVNGCIADRIVNRREPRRRLLPACGMAAAAMALVIGYGFIRISLEQTRRGPTVFLVQGNVPSELKYTPSLDEAFRTLERHVELSEPAAEKQADLVIWAETMVPVPMNWLYDAELVGRVAAEMREYTRFMKDCHKAIIRTVLDTGSYLLLGAETNFLKTGAHYNSAYFLSPSAKLLGRYDKIHIVVFGEYTPFAKVFPFFKTFRPPQMGPDMSAGDERTLFELPLRDGSGSAKFGVTICYEGAEAGLFREFARAGADFMVNITNDGWFRDSSELDHHLAVCAFRAVENRLPIARCANTGISAIIAPNGCITQQIAAPDGKRREIEGTLAGNLEMSNLKSLYSRCGDLFAWLCIAGCVIIIILRRKRRGS